jgi:hypothetical protein
MRVEVGVERVNGQRGAAAGGRDVGVWQRRQVRDVEAQAVEQRADACVRRRLGLFFVGRFVAILRAVVWLSSFDWSKLDRRG